MFMCPDAHGAMWMWVDKRKGRRETITVYLVTNALYDQYAPYIQAQLPDVNI